MDVPAGTTYSLEVWLNLLLVRSYGDAANTIAHGLAGSVDQFVVWMNEKAQELGLTDTVVDNAIGLDIGNNFNNIHTTANDMLRMTLEAMKYPLIRQIVSQEEYLVPANGTIEEQLISNSNALLSEAEIYNSNLFVPIGGKTGSTDAAGKCLATFVKSNSGREYVCVYFGAKKRATMYSEIIGILEYAIMSCGE